MKTFVSYKQQPVDGKYDAVIIGSGIGGLATAAILAKEGKRVLVLEKHYAAGGFSHTFKRKNYEWDVGVHYVGGMDKPTRILKKIFDHITNQQLQWADMGEVYDRIIFGEKEYRFVKGLENWKQQMKTYFPAAEDGNAIDDYVDLVFKANAGSRNFFAEKVVPPAVSWLAGSLMRSKFLKFSNQTTLDVLRSITNNQELIGVLTAQFGDYGLTPSESSFAMHAMLVNHYFNGGYYPVGGSASIAESIAPVIEQAGGKIYISADVSEIIVRNNTAVGVKMEDGKEILSDIIISNAGFINTFSKLLPENIAAQAGYLKHLKTVKPSAAHLSLYIGLQHSSKELNLPKANYWIYPDNYDHDENMRNYLNDPSAPLPVAYISFPAAKDPDFENRFPGRSTIEIIGFAPYEWFARWEGTRWHKRGDDYEQMKEQFSQRLLEQLYRVEPQVKGKIDHSELSTPLSTANFVNYSKGEIYGLSHSPDRFRHTFLKPRTAIKNLYLTGQDIITCGVGGALISGVLTSSVILKKNVMSELMQKG